MQLRGWVRTVRAQKDLSFIEVNDGSSLSGIQAVVNGDVPGREHLDAGDITTGAAVLIKGTVVESPGGKQAVEVAVESIKLIGGADASTFPLQKKRHTLEYLRSIAHLRPRTNTIGAVTRVRNQLAYATHTFFQQHGFQYVNTPIVTASDCEGAGEQFQVTTLINGIDGPASPPPNRTSRPRLTSPPPRPPPRSRASSSRPSRMPRRRARRRRRRWTKPRRAPRAQGEGESLEFSAAAGGRRHPRDAAGAVDYGNDFFGKPSYLTVSGQLNAEIYACAMRDVYTFGPTFRAENSNTSRHLAEFGWSSPSSRSRTFRTTWTAPRRTSSTA